MAKLIDNEFEGMYKIIIEYLKKYDDPVFKAKLEASEQTPYQLKKYISKEAKKYLKSGEGGIADEIVYGWAIHFIDENIQFEANKPEANKPKTNSSALPKAEVVKPKKVKAKEKEQDKQLSLFDDFITGDDGQLRLVK